uniref:Uncharacterized protein n=1 Tax=Grammatophora oceanica TaxID=210454 RepID=A0A7S1VAE6_9STRA|mmetsp:Transcript_41140/g.60916  ORF Transcript_41140/g.60916 Transcript_41140/m.60916 type:complete len:196 (+) Transcript_41140:556-1143(+)
MFLVLDRKKIRDKVSFAFRQAGMKKRCCPLQTIRSTKAATLPSSSSHQHTVLILEGETKQYDTRTTQSSATSEEDKGLGQQKQGEQNQPGQHQHQEQEQNEEEHEEEANEPKELGHEEEEQSVLSGIMEVMLSPEEESRISQTDLTGELGYEIDLGSNEEKDEENQDDHGPTPWFNTDFFENSLACSEDFLCIGT